MPWTLKIEERPQAKARNATLEARKGKVIDYPLKPLEGPLFW